MFDDPDIKQELLTLKADLHNDVSLMSNQNESFDYPVIKARYDEIDTEIIPHHWQNIHPLLYHLFIWAGLKQSILEISDEESNSKNRMRQIIHRKSCLKYEIANFEARLKELKFFQSVLIDLKVEFQKISAKQRVRPQNHEFFIDYGKDVVKVCTNLHKNGSSKIKLSEFTSDLGDLLYDFSHIDELKSILVQFWTIDESHHDQFSSQQSQVVSDEEEMGLKPNKIKVKTMMNNMKPQFN